MSRPSHAIVRRTLNWDHIPKQLGKVLRVFPRPISHGPGKARGPFEWPLRLSEVNKGEGWIVLHASATGHDIRLWSDGVKGFTMPDLLELRVQIVITPEGVTLEPIATSGPTTVADVAAGAIEDLSARVHRLQQALSLLPQPGSEAQADHLARYVPMWDATELEAFQAAASKVDRDTARTAAEALTSMKYLGDRVHEVRSVNQLLGYDWGQFNWRVWHFYWNEARTKLEQLEAALHRPQ